MEIANTFIIERGSLPIPRFCWLATRYYLTRQVGEFMTTSCKIKPSRNEEIKCTKGKRDTLELSLHTPGLATDDFHMMRFRNLNSPILPTKTNTCIRRIPIIVLKAFIHQQGLKARGQSQSKMERLRNHSPMTTLDHRETGNRN